MWFFFNSTFISLLVSHFYLYYTSKAKFTIRYILKVVFFLIINNILRLKKAIYFIFLHVLYRVNPLNLLWHQHVEQNFDDLMLKIRV